MGKLCLIFNTPSLYRKSIYSWIDRKFDCVWHFGDWDANVKSFDVSSLEHPVFFLHVNYPGKSFYYIDGLLALLKDKSYDRYLMIGDARDISTWRMLIVKILFYRKKKVYFWTHGWYGKEKWLDRLIKRFFFWMVDGVFLYGNYAKELMIKNGVNKNKLFVIHNSLDYDTQLGIRNQIKASYVYKEHFKNSNRNLIFLGRLTPIKRLDLLLEAVSVLKSRGVVFNVTFIGDGSERTALEKRAKELRINEQVWFYGSCYDEMINAEFVFNADLCVSPGNVGLTAIHMLMFGTPVITHNRFELQMPEFEAISPLVTGSFFKYDDVNDLCDKIQEWFFINGDRRLFVRQACYNEIDTRWTPEYQMNVIDAVLGEIR